jgi:class 3 adenylate cyclase/tetratricopeptide (TPR) repeat protein
MTCANCGAESPAGRKFCDTCGQPLSAPCPNCGASNRPGAKFCGECGTALTGDPAAQADLSSAAERRLVSVLFADLVGFTPFSEEQDAEEVRDFLGRYFDIGREIVGRYGGTVEKFIGDAVMAVWGTPTAHEDDAERAVRAALEIVDAVRGLAPGIQARAGVLTGEAAVSLGAGNQSMVAGDLVNTASRLQSVAQPGTVLVGEATMRAASSAIAFEPAGEHTLKGKASPVPAWSALRVVANRGGAGRSEALEAPFVGRTEEFRLLKDLLHTTGRDPRVRLASVTGPAGIGKSRLAWELEKYVDGVLETIYWHRGRSPAYGEGITFWALGEMVRQRARLAETDDEATTRTRISEAVAEYVSDPEDRRWIEPALLTLLGLELSPPGGRDALFSAWRMFFERVAERGTTVLVFEDLQWADTGLLDFIDHLMEWSKGAPILVITLARPELFDRRADWGAGKRNFTSLGLEPLSEKAMRELLAGLAPGLPDETVTTIVTRADGVPLYAVETVRMLVGDGRLQLVEGAYQPIGDLGDLAVPDSLRSLIASRLDGLDPTDRNLLQDAAVLGQSFTTAGLEAVSGLSQEELKPRLTALVRRELLQVEMDPRSPERGQYAFVQALIREVAYGTLAKSDRRRRHVAAAEFFESLGDDELAGAVAKHYLDAHRSAPAGPEAEQIAERARLALTSAGDRAASLGAHEQAVALLELALSVTDQPAMQAEVLERAATSSNAAGRYSAAEAYSRRAIEILRPTGDAPALARLYFQLGQSLINEGDVAAAIDEFEAALAERPLGSENVDEAQSRLLAGLAHAYQRHAEYERAASAADRALAAAERLDLVSIIAQAMVTKGTVLAPLGRRREAAALLEAGVLLAKETGQISLELRARNNLAATLSDDDLVQSRQILQEGLELAEKVGDRQMTTWMVMVSGIYAHMSGDGWDEVLRRLDEELERSTEPGDRIRVAQLTLSLRTERGEVSPDQIDEVTRGVAHMSETGLSAGNHFLRAMNAMVHGEFEVAFDEAIRAVEIERQIGWVASHLAGMAALWLRDVDRARAAAERIDAATRTGRITEFARMSLRAAVATLEGRRQEAVSGFREAIRGMHDLGSNLHASQIGLAFALAVGPSNPEGLAAAQEAREFFARVGARPWVEMTDAVLSGQEPPILTPSPLPEEAPIA